MNFIKKQGVGIWISLGAVLCTLIAMIIYGVALKGGMDLTIASGSQPFYSAVRDEDSIMMSAVTACGVIALLCLAAVIVLGQFEFDGAVGKIVKCTTGVLRVVAPALLLATFMYFLYGSFTGLGWTFFSNAELAISPDAIAVGKQVITGEVFFVIAAVAAIVAAFFGLRGKKSDANA